MSDLEKIGLLAVKHKLVRIAMIRECVAKNEPLARAMDPVLIKAYAELDEALMQYIKNNT